MTRRIRAVRSRIEDDDHGNERWLVSYADFITLLFAFFVVLYSISTVNTGKFRVLSDSLETVLTTTQNNPPDHRRRPVESQRAVPVDFGGGRPPRDGLLDGTRHLAAVDEAASAVAIKGIETDIVAPAVPIVGTPRERLEAAVGAFGGRDDVKLRETADWLEIELGSEVLFASGSAALNPAAEPALAKVAAVVADMGNPVRVEGFTDNVITRGGPLGSNWGISAARAATIADRLVASRVIPRRISATGFGEFRPIADNATSEGRRQNRRVVIAIAKNDHVSLAVGAAAADQATQESPDVETPQPAQSLLRVLELPGPAEIDQ